MDGKSIFQMTVSRKHIWDSGSSSWTWGSLTTSATPWFSQDSNGDWAMTKAWDWSDSQNNFAISIAAGDVNGNLDPFINYKISVKNNTPGLKTFQQVVTAPISPTISGLNQVRASVSGGTTDATGDGVSITPAPNRNQDANNGNELQLFLLNNSNNFSASGSYINAGVDVGGAETDGGPPNSFTYGAYAEGPIAGPLGSWNFMQTRTRFTLTGNGDSAVINGYANITAVPEAKTYAMMLVGLGLIGFTVVRRRSI